MNSSQCEADGATDVEPALEKEIVLSPAVDAGQPFNATEIERFQSDDAEAGIQILRILAGGFVYTFLAGAITTYWIFAGGVSIHSIVSLPSIVVIAIVVGLGWGKAMVGYKDSDH